MKKSLYARVNGEAAKGERGVTVFVTAAALLFLIPMVGLSIDGGMAFLVKSRLGAALDAAALAAGRSVVLGSDVPGAQAAAQTAATQFFNANFPSQYMNTDSSNRSVTATLTPQNNGTLSISVTASVSEPMYFMRWLGVNNMTIAATGTATRRNLVMMLVLDKSSSMGSRSAGVPTVIDYSSATSCEAMVYNAIQFINNFSPFDTIGMISFNNTAFLDYSPSTHFKDSGSSGMTQAIGNITCGGNTNTTAALNLAAQQITGVGQRLAVNHIVLFTDGVANGISADFPIRTQVDTRLGPCDHSAAACLGIADTPAGNNAKCNDLTGKGLCTNMPACTATGGTLRAVLAQQAGFSLDTPANPPGNNGRNLAPAFSTESVGSSPSGCPSTDTARATQVVAYIPSTDRFGNSTSGPWDNTVEGNNTDHVNWHCMPSGAPVTPGNSSCKSLTDLWTKPAYSALGVGAPSNKFTAGPYINQFRPDLPNTIGITSLNTAVNQANTIRGTAGFNITIDTIYLQGNGGDPVEPTFLQIVSNQPTLQTSIYEASTYNANLDPPYDFTTTTNTNYVANQSTGVFAATASTSQLANAFGRIASSLLRISQ
jgi:Flp pilus assembly protein TadG